VRKQDFLKSLPLVVEDPRLVERTRQRCVGRLARKPRRLVMNVMLTATSAVATIFLFDVLLRAARIYLRD
jgi:hypothetical protein